jgi:hypothetical protein
MRMTTPVVMGMGIIFLAAVAGAQAVKTEAFERDPNWDGYNNRVVAEAPKTVRQDFGYSETTFAGKDKGEVGGTVWRDSKTASYAMQIPAKTLSDRLSASGTLAITDTDGSSSIFLGFFKSGDGDESDSGRQNSLGLRFAGQGEGARLTLQLVTATNQACGTKVTTWVVDKSKPIGAGRKVRPPEIKNDGTRYKWQLDYDPAGADGDGEMRFTMRTDSAQPPAEPPSFEGKTFTVALPKGYKEHGTTFDRFGLVNGMRPGNSMTLYVDDLVFDGKAMDFATDPGWIGVGNHESYVRSVEGGVHDFGYSATHFAGGASAGELGGTIWRSGVYGFYGDNVGPLSLNDKLEASGKVVLNVGPPDSGMYIGFFNADEREYSPVQAGNFVGVKIGGPTRVGHYFVPAYLATQTKKPEKGDKKTPPSLAIERGTGPVLVPQKQFDWKLAYDPAAEGGNGGITVTLGDATVTLPLKPGDKEKGATLNRFGLFTTHRGGSYVKIYFDDLKYTAAKAAE